MTLFTNNAEGGSNGTAVATTDTGSGTSFTDVTPGTGGTITYATAAAQKGSLGYSFVAAASNSCFTDWVNLAGATNTGFALRAYVYIPTLPATNAQPLFTVRSAGGGTGVLTYQLAVTGLGSHLFVSLDGNAGATLASSTSTYTFLAATWYRIETQITNPTSTTSSLAYQIYLGDSTTAVTGGTYSISSTNLFSTASLGTVRWGRPAAVGSAFTVYFDDVAAATATSTAIGASTASQSFSGSVALSGSGTLSDTGGMGQTAAEALSGSGTTSYTSTSMAVTAPLLLADDGTTTFVGTPATSGSVALSGSGTQTSTGTSAQTATGSVDLSGSGTFTDTANGVTTTGSEGLTGSGTLAGSSAVVTASGSWAASGSGLDVLSVSTTSMSGSDNFLAGSGTASFTVQTLNTHGTAGPNGSSVLTLTGSRGVFKYINSVTYTATANNTFTVTVPTSVTTTHLGVLLIGTGTNGTDTFSATGWTSRVSNPAGENNSEVAVLTRLGGLVAGNTFTITSTVSHFTTIMAVWYDTQGYDVATVGTPGTRNATSSVYTTAGGLSTTALNQPLIICFTDRSTASGTTITGFTGGSGIQPQADAFFEDSSANSNVSLWSGSTSVATPTTIGSLTAAYTTASTNSVGVMMAIYSPDNLGSVALTGSGTLSAVGHPNGSVAFSGDSSSAYLTLNRSGAITLTGGSLLVPVKSTQAPIFEYDGTQWVPIVVFRYDGNGWVPTAVIAY